MAIDNSARRSVEAIVLGGKPQPHDDPKAVLYGNFAHFMPDPNIAARLQDYSCDNLFQLELGVREVLEDGLSSRFMHRGFDEMMELDAAFEARDAALPVTHKMFSFPHRRLKDGIATAANIEILTVRTLAKIASEGTAVSKLAFDKSYRVPFRLALLHMLDLNAIEYDKWDRPEEVFAQDSYSFDPGQGMKLRTGYSTDTPDLDHQLLGPQIGCPATFLRGYIATLHKNIASAAVAKHLIQISA